MSEQGSREKTAVDWKFWITLAVAIAFPTLGTCFGIWAAFSKLQASAEFNQKANEEGRRQAEESLRLFQTQNKEALEAAIRDSNARYEALQLRIGNQDVLINNITTMTTRLDERLTGMANTAAQISARRDQQMDAILDGPERSRQDEMLSRERQARIEAMLGTIMRSEPGASDTAPRWKKP